MPLTTPFNSRHALAKRIQDHAKPVLGVLNLLPHNRFVEDSHIWWLVPSRSVPAFCDTKYYVGRDLAQTGLMDVGIYVEKGYDKVVSMAYTNATRAGWIMDDTWQWRTFLGLIEKGRIVQAMQDAASALGQPVYLRLDAYPIQSRAEVPLDIPAEPSARVRYRMDPLATELLLDDEYSHPTGILRDYPHTPDSSALYGWLDALTQDKQAQWHWIDLTIATPFAPIAEAQQDGSTWDARRIWTDYLQPLSFAVKSMHL